ncbi:hypothetical protein AG1IA_07211 [Rhizoctonia solani AG-1 IA]|uniref:Ubiquitin domain-containing protein n=1 Tax=Thanatephorus cucumeris (strain AG1-IA) TaxID=983506 RepID=L8WLI5_THACA|nr:hypothetical protein AG1IA_07211 [Rhizoctonia solani AG-1 IA]
MVLAAPFNVRIIRSTAGPLYVPVTSQTTILEIKRKVFEDGAIPPNNQREKTWAMMTQRSKAMASPLKPRGFLPARQCNLTTWRDAGMCASRLEFEKKFTCNFVGGAPSTRVNESEYGSRLSCKGVRTVDMQGYPRMCLLIFREFVTIALQAFGNDSGDDRRPYRVWSIFHHLPPNPTGRTASLLVSISSARYFVIDIGCSPIQWLDLSLGERPNKIPFLAEKHVEVSCPKRSNNSQPMPGAYGFYESVRWG